MAIECRCEPCPFDIRTLGYSTAKEDPAFEGTQCLWHEHIVGRGGYIYCSGGTSEDPLFVSQDKDGHNIKENFSLSEIRRQANKIKAIR